VDRLCFPIAIPNGNLSTTLICPWEARNNRMAKPHRKLKKANHGKRPANSKARRLKRADIRT